MVQHAMSFLLMSFTMSMVVLFVLFLNALFFKWLDARLRYAVWLVVLVGLLVPFRPVIGEGFITVPYVSQEELGVLHSSDGGLPAAEGLAPDVISQNVFYRVLNLSISYPHILVMLWSAVAAIIFAYHIWRYIQFTKIMRRWGKVVQDREILEIFQSVKRDHGLKNVEIGLMQCGFVTTSLLIGFFKPVVLLPEKHFESDELEMIFHHELIHYKRKDLLVKFLSVIAVSVHWFNPVIYWMCDNIQTESESSCDEAVVKEFDGENRRYYAELIIEMAGNKKSTTMLSTCFYGGKKSLERRLESIMDTTKKMKSPAYAALLTIDLVTVMSGSVFAFTMQELQSGSAPDGAREITSAQTAVRTPSNSPVTTLLTMEEAIQIAIDAVGGGMVEKVEYEYRNGRPIFEVKVRHGRLRYEVYVNGTTGEVLRVKRD